MVELPPYYHALYTHICKVDGTPVGGGICVDGIHVITCAHVVNAALGKNNILSIEQPEGTIKVIFPRNDEISAITFESRVVAWSWNDLENNGSGFWSTSSLTKNDLAVIALTIEDQVCATLKQHARSLRFLKGNLKNSPFEAWILNRKISKLPINVTGTLGSNDSTTGSTVITPSENSRIFFFDKGSSGSPVFCTTRLHEIANPNLYDDHCSGIAGYVEYLNKSDNALDGRMIYGANIERLIKRHLPSLQIQFIDIEKKKLDIKKQLLQLEIINNRGIIGKEIFCDRKPQITHLTNKHESAPVSRHLLFGNNRQKLDAFIDRYRWQYIAPTGIRSMRKHITMPWETDKTLFTHKLIQNLFEAFFHNAPLRSHLPTDQLTITDVFNEIDPERKCYVIDFRIDGGNFSPDQAGCYEWFYQYFLAPLQTNEVNHLHVFVSFSYTPSNRNQVNLDVLLKIFKDIDIPELIDVPRREVEEWLDLVEGEDRARRDEIIKHFPLQNQYDMLQIMEYYKKALKELESF